MPGHHQAPRPARNDDQRHGLSPGGDPSPRGFDGLGLGEVQPRDRRLDALENRLAIRPLHEKHAFIPQHVGAVNLNQTTEKILEFDGIEGLVRAKNEGLHRFVMLVLVAGQELGIDLEDGVQIEAPDIEDVGDVGIAEVDRLDR